MDLLTLRYPSGVGVLTGVRSHWCFGREPMRQTFAHEHENATMAWLGGALDTAHSHGQSKALAYLEAVMEEVVFEEEMAAREAHVVG